MFYRIIGLLISGLFASGQAVAETADYGQIELTGLSRDVSWPLNPAGPAYAMICNVNGPDGYLSIRTAPGSQHGEARRLKRLAIVEIDTRERRGHWVRVLDAHRSFTSEGRKQDFKHLPVTGWAHDGYLCSYVDYPQPGAFDHPAEPDMNSSAATTPEEYAIAQAATHSRRARCEWDNGLVDLPETYPCTFVPFAGNGSFSVIRDDTYELMLTIEQPGIANIQEYGDGRALANYGRFYRSESDRACWISETKEEKLCVR
ncbi:hypothetical protein [Jiella marina]|uniref:hypothetical protein n=1 Tax=Jiella sp. LLJ827 TaxID=2917712 RepID=UPI002101754E|nr:hypothetical protein [Jiella sp. LLJ827]MCQ0987229.1 hypothetical protein [Jiella sp. LLJ827]